MLSAAQVEKEGVVCVALLCLHQKLLEHAAVLLGGRGGDVLWTYRIEMLNEIFLGEVGSLQLTRPAQYFVVVNCMSSEENRNSPS